MTGASVLPASCCKFELEIAIDAPQERVWGSLFSDIAHWWLPDFHMAGPDSKITFDPQPGGRGLVEDTTNGGGLQWYTVQMHLPDQFKIYLIGHIASDWGGPCTSSLMLAVEEAESGCVLKVVDARHGNIDEQQVQSSSAGWAQLFTDGLKAHVEG